MATDFVVNALESIEIYDADGDLDGYALVLVPSWYKGGAHYTDAAYDRLMATNPVPLTPMRSSRTNAWSDADAVRYVGGQGFRYFPSV